MVLPLRKVRKNREESKPLSPDQRYSINLILDKTAIIIKKKKSLIAVKAEVAVQKQLEVLVLMLSSGLPLAHTSQKNHLF